MENILHKKMAVINNITNFECPARLRACEREIEGLDSVVITRRLLRKMTGNPMTARQFFKFRAVGITLGLRIRAAVRVGASG